MDAWLKSPALSLWANPVGWLPQGTIRAINAQTLPGINQIRCVRRSKGFSAPGVEEEGMGCAERERQPFALTPQHHLVSPGTAQAPSLSLRHAPPVTALRRFPA
jgi:hypothetical protein